MEDGGIRRMSSTNQSRRSERTKSNINIRDLEGQDELFMTISCEEEKEWENMMKNKRDKMIKNIENHKQWTDAFTRRRMFAYSRIRKLDQARRDRIKFVSKMAEVVKNANEKLEDVEQNSAADEERSQEGNGVASKRVTFDVANVDNGHGNGINETSEEGDNAKKEMENSDDDKVKNETENAESEGARLKDKDEVVTEEETKVS